MKKKLTPLEIIRSVEQNGEPLTTQQVLMAMEMHTTQFIGDAEIFIEKLLMTFFQTEQLRDANRAEWNKMIELKYPKLKS